MNARALSIDFVADLCCPWCYVAWRALDRALAMRTDIECAPRWGAFLLRPDTPPEGLDRKAYMAKIFADRPQQAEASRAALYAAADDAQCDLDLDAATVMPNTMNAHRLIAWATGQGRTREMIDALFAAYFVHGLDIGAAPILGAIAESAGLDGEVVRDLLDSDADWSRVADAHNGAVQAGVRGVPVVIFNRRLARQGAESVAIYGRCIDEAMRV
jgi:predicted DsbA family dithiol-disulfide isomerase